MFIKQCPRCRRNHAIYYYNKEDGGMHTICKDCRQSLFNYTKYK